MLQIGAGQHATLTLLHPAPYREIAILSSSGNASETAIGIFTINYADGSSIAAAYNTFDWCNDARHPQAVLTPAAGFPGTARNCPGNLSFPQNRTRFVYNTDCSDFNIYETIISTDNRKNIVSFTFTAPESANWTNIFGVSGIQ